MSSGRGFVWSLISSMLRVEGDAFVWNYNALLYADRYELFKALTFIFELEVILIIAEIYCLKILSNNAPSNCQSNGLDQCDMS